MSSKIDRLIQRYELFCSLPWEKSLAGAQRVWFVVYDKADERRLRARVDEFEVATKRSGHKWHHLDVTSSFGRWLSQQEYHESYFESPEDLDSALPEYERSIVECIRRALESPTNDETSVVAVSGIASLFGLVKVSSVIHSLAPRIRGRLVVFFPGEHEDNNYRLLDARDGWNYMALPITGHDGLERGV